MYLLFFDTKIWGTVSDWVMVCVTTVTAFYLYRTLKSQKEVQQIQYELFKIESIRFKESIKPIFKYSASERQFSSDNGKKKMLTIEVTNETDSIALEISRIVESNEQTTQLFTVTGLSDRKDHLAKGDPPMLFHFAVDPEDRVSGWVIFAINYKDVAGTKYKQRVICICDNYGIELNPFLPEQIES
ncbi:MAG TPA: hypothetical protein VK718_06165 [Ferruginibacter sp.]|jgi:hypothetical protein|nr:hypothetical protein [Ferruginibacter sp.]